MTDAERWAESVWQQAARVVGRDLVADLLDPDMGRSRIEAENRGTPFAGFLGDLRQTSRHAVVEARLDAHGAERGLDVDLWAITTQQADEMLASVARVSDKTFKRLLPLLVAVAGFVAISAGSVRKRTKRAAS